MTTFTTVLKENKLSKINDLELVFLLKEKGVSFLFRNFRWGKLELLANKEDFNIIEKTIASPVKKVIRNNQTFLRIG